MDSSQSPGEFLKQLIPRNLRKCRLLSHSDLYRRFESFPLRQQVLTAEKSRRLFPRNTRKMPIFRDSSSANRTAEKGPLDGDGGIFLAFLWRAHARSGFEEGIRRMQCDHKSAIQPRRVDFCQHLKPRSATQRHGSIATSAFIGTDRGLLRSILGPSNHV
jgi:hypothetical protein